MATETDTTHSGWNTNTLKEFVSTSVNDLRAMQEALRQADDLRYQQRFEAQQKMMADAMASAEKAVVKAETAAEKRFESVNEFRAVLSSQSATLLPRAEADTQFKAIADKIDDLKGRMDRRDGLRTGVRSERVDHHMTVGTVLGVLGGVVGLLSFLALLVFGVINTVRATAPTPTVVSPAVVPLTK